MIEISLYRQQIGSFIQKHRKLKFPKNYYLNIRKPCYSDYRSNHSWIQILVIVLTVFLVNNQVHNPVIFRSRANQSTSGHLFSYNYNAGYCRTNIGMIGNFYGRYLNGNIKNTPKGVKVNHLNIRSLQNKVC